MWRRDWEKNEPNICKLIEDWSPGATQHTSILVTIIVSIVGANQHTSMLVTQIVGANQHISIFVAQIVWATLHTSFASTVFLNFQFFLSTETRPNQVSASHLGRPGPPVLGLFSHHSAGGRRNWTNAHWAAHGPPCTVDPGHEVLQ